MNSFRQELVFGAAFVVFLIGIATLIVFLLSRSEKAAADRLRRIGMRCVAYVKSYRRVSMTQHRVLLEIHLPTGRIGREYLLSNLSDAWLADVCALAQPVSVVAHPEASTILFVS